MAGSSCGLHDGAARGLVATAIFEIRFAGRPDATLGYLVTHIADCLTRLGRTDPALVAHRRALWHWDKSTFRWVARVLHARIEIARLLVAKGEIDQARAEYELAIAEINPNGPDHALRDVARRELSRLDERPSP
jgi:tetratricopeptide (TPR) repeat protein